MKKVQTINAHNGQIVPLINNKRIHSQFNPEKEAERYIHSLSKKKKEQIIIFGETIGYLTKAAITHKYKKIIIFASIQKFIKELEQIKNKQKNQIEISIINVDPNDVLFINNIDSSFNFIEEKLKDIPLKNTQIAIWNPTFEADPKLTLLLLGFNRWTKRILASETTSIVFAKKWISNSTKNINQLKQFIKPIKINKPIIISAAGPSLTKQLEWLKENRANYRLLALTSSCQALFEASLTPDWILHTDPGYWAKQLLQKTLRYNQNKTMPIMIQPLSAAPIGNYNSPVIIINQNTILDQIMKCPTIAGLTIPETGSAACTALLAATQLSTQKPIFAGLDLEAEEELHHTIAHLSIDKVRTKSDKTDSTQNKLYQQWLKNKDTTLTIFHDWFISKAAPPFLRLEKTAFNTPKNFISFKEAETYIKNHNLQGDKKLFSKIKANAINRDAIQQIKNNEGLKKILAADYFGALKESDQIKKLNSILNEINIHSKNRGSQWK